MGRSANKSRQQWQALIERYEQRSVNAEVFCQQEGICLASLFRWRKLLLGGVARAVPAGAPSDAVAPESRPDSFNAGFVDLGSMVPAGAPLELRLDLGGGVQLILRRG